VALDDDHPGRLSRVKLRSGIEAAQASGEEIGISAPAWMMRTDEIPAAAPDFASVGFVHRQSRGHLRSSA
jgi:hypothetical protein